MAKTAVVVEYADRAVTRARHAATIPAICTVFAPAESFLIDDQCARNASPFQSRLRSRHLRTNRRGSQGIKMSKLRNDLERSRRGVDAFSNLVHQRRRSVAQES